MKIYDLNTISKPSFGDFHIESGRVNGDFVVHTHDFCEIFLVLSGTGVHISGETEYPLQKGELFAVKGTECHGFRSCNNLKIINIMFQVSFLLIQECKMLPGFWVLFLHEQRLGSISHITLSPEKLEEVLHWCNMMQKEYDASAEGSPAVCHAVLTQLIIFLSRACEQIPENMAQSDYRLAKSLIYLETNYMEPVKLDDLAAAVGFSRRHFSRLFQKLYHKTPMEYLLKVRMFHACHLLSKTNAPITEVANLCGFSDGNHFSKIFKQQTSFSPAAWRKNMTSSGYDKRV